MFGWIIYRLNSLELSAGQFCGKELILRRRTDCWDAEWFVRKQDCGIRGAGIWGLKGLLYRPRNFNRSAVTENRGRGPGSCWCNPLFPRCFSFLPALAFLWHVIITIMTCCTDFSVCVSGEDSAGAAACVLPSGASGSVSLSGSLQGGRACECIQLIDINI